MSTFDGVIKEYPLISIDNFLKKSMNFRSTVYFLSHCHADHMRGLGDRKFFELLEFRGFSRLYVSDVSEHLLKNDERYCHLSKYLVSLPIEQPTLIDVFDKHGNIVSRVVITLLTAGHCPGSVMFLIEGENGRVLYTGDFRLPVGGSARFPCLHDENGRLKPVDGLYIDTTFCSKKCLYIPTREQCLVEILKLVKEWLAKGPDHIVRFICPAQYNYEFVFVELFKELGEKTHVFEDKLRKYKGIKVIEDAVTSVPTEARIHACMSGYSNDFKEILYVYETPCEYHTEDRKPIKVRLIKLSAMFFQHNNYTDLSVVDPATKVHRVCFSTHSSLEEIRDMVKYLKPTRVYPNVVEKTTVEQILYLIRAPFEDADPDSLSPLGSLRNLNQEDSIPSTNSLPFFDSCYGIPHQEQLLLVPNSNVRTEATPQNPCLPEININNSDNETTQDSPTLLRSKITSFNGGMTSLAKPDCPSVKWEGPILSSDDENFNPNSSFSSSKDESEAWATSEEQNLVLLADKCIEAEATELDGIHSEKSSSPVPLRISEHKPSVSKQKCEGGIHLELQKLLDSQELSLQHSACSGSAITSKNFPDKKSQRDSCPVADEIILYSFGSCKDVPLSSASKNSLGHLEETKELNGDRLEGKSHAQHIENPVVVEESSWRESKLFLEQMDFIPGVSKGKEVIPKSPVNQHVGIVADALNKEISASNTDFQLNTKTKEHKPSFEKMSSHLKSSSKPSISKDSQSLRSFSDKRIIIGSNSQKPSKVIKKKKHPKPTRRRAAKQDFRPLESKNEPFKVIGAPAHINAFSDLIPTSFSKKLQDPFASKYEKSLVKVKPSTSYHSKPTFDEEVLFLPATQDLKKDIQVVDLTSEDALDSDVELFADANLDTEQACPKQSENRAAHTLDSSDELKEDSPNLLVPPWKKKDSVAAEISDTGRKRKVSNKDDFSVKKSPKSEDDRSRHSVCDGGIDSTPEDWLPFTHSQVSSYLKNISDWD